MFSLAVVFTDSCLVHFDILIRCSVFLDECLGWLLVGVVCCLLFVGGGKCYVLITWSHCMLLNSGYGSFKRLTCNVMRAHCNKEVLIDTGD